MLAWLSKIRRLIRNALVVNWRELYYKCDLPRPISTVDPEYTLTAIVLFVVQTLVFMPRIVTLSFGLGQWYKDDTSCVVAYVSFPLILVVVTPGLKSCYEDDSMLTNLKDTSHRTIRSLCSW